MPKYRVKDNESGKIITFDWHDANPPTDADMEEVFKSAQAPQEPSLGQRIYQKGIAPTVELGGLMLGGMLGSAGGPIGTVAGAAGGYTAARSLTKAGDVALGYSKPETPVEALKRGGENLLEGATMEMGGQVAGKVIAPVAKFIGKGLKQTLGATTGSGPGMAEEALRGTKPFKDAMRGKISGEDVVKSADDALQSIKINRALKYQQQLAEVAKNQGNLDTTPIQNQLSNLIKKYNITYDPVKQQFDYSRIAMGKAGRKDIKGVIDTLNSWGNKQGDNTAVGLDTLKRQLDDFYSDSSQARAFVSQLRNVVRDTISKNVPQYGEMTKGYAEASNLIKDIESGLMLRKQGMTGRITPDMTLRRLTSAMRENFEMRKDLLNALGEQGGSDVAAKVAGYSANQIIPRGLMGKLSAGSIGALTYVNPKFWPLLAASSPRAVGEFLTIYGKGLKEVKNISPAVYRMGSYYVVKMKEDNLDEYIKSYQEAQ